MTDAVIDYCVSLYARGGQKPVVRFDKFDATTMLRRNRSMSQYKSSLEFVKDDVQSSAYNVYEFEQHDLRIYEILDVCDTSKLPIARDYDIAVKIENTVKALKIVRQTVDDRSVQLKLSDAFTSNLNADIGYENVSDERLRQYLINELRADKLMIQKSMTKQIYHNLNSGGGRVYYGVLPMLSFLYKLKVHAPSGNWYMELLYWTRSFVYDLQHLAPRQSVGPMALSLIVDSATAISGEPIAFINFEALYGTQLVLQKMREQGLKFILTKVPRGFEEQHLIINNPDFSTYWKRFAIKRRKTACIQCRLCDAPLYRGKENLIFCGNACHEEYFNICSTLPCL